MPKRLTHYSNSKELLLTLVFTVFLSACGSENNGDANSAPTATSGTIYTFINKSVTGKLSGTDDDGDTISYSIIEQAKLGTITLEDPATGKFTFVPEMNQSGTDTFVFQVKDSHSASGTGVITIHISETPLANDDNYTTSEGSVLAVDAATGFISNDILPETYSTVTLTSSPRHAADFIFSEDGSFTYTHDGSENISDEFSYKVSTASGDSNVAIVTINISPQNDAPQAIADTYIVPVGTTLSVSSLNGVLLNDQDPDNSIEELSVTLVGQGPQNAASFTLNPNGSFSYTHNGATNVSTDSFQYIVSDGLLQSETVTVTLNIVPLNNAPVASDDIFSVDEGGTLTIPSADGLLSNDSDSDDPASNLITSMVSAPANASSFVLYQDGSFSYVHDGSENSSDSFQYQVSDGKSNSNIATVTININFINDAPVAVNDTYSVAEGGTLSLTAANGILSNGDGDNETPLNQLTLIQTSADPAYASSFTLNPDGSLVYAHDGSESTTATFSYKLSDGQKDSNIAIVTINITPVNDAPVATAGICESGKRENIISGFLGGNDPDNLPTELLFDIPLANNGSKGTAILIDETTGQFEYTPNGNDWGLDSFSFTVTDPDGKSSEETVYINVEPRIMPLGDSITQGIITGQNDGPASPYRAGYRHPLYLLLADNGYATDFVGGLTDGESVTPAFDFEHEGHPGWTSSQIAFGKIGDGSDGVAAWLDTNPADIILLHAGTNNFTTDASGVESILNEIDSWETTNGRQITVFLAKIINMRDPVTNETNPDVFTYNDNLVSMATARTGDDIIIVNQHDALSYPTDLLDDAYGLHPTATGYGKMANTWYNSLNNSGLLEKCP